jgi:intein/homing endonuclease
VTDLEHKSSIVLNEEQSQALEILREGGNLFLTGPAGTGKCLGAGTLILRADGRVMRVEDTLPGDRLMGPDGRARTVLSVASGFDQLYRIVPTRGEPWVCNSGHILTLVRSDTGRIVDIALNDWLASGTYFKKDCKLFSVGVDAFEDADANALDVGPYFLGVWFGDGTKGARRQGKLAGEIASVKVSKPDVEIAEVCEATAAEWGLTSRNTASKNRCPTWSLSGVMGRANPLLDKIRALIGPDLRLPKAVMYGGREVRAQFLAGFLDTDGHLIDNCFEITQRREDWARGVWWLARSLGLCATIRNKIVNSQTYYRVYISGDVVKIPTRVRRKIGAARKQVKNATRTGFTVSPVGIGAFYGFTLDGDGRFLLGDFTVTHNTAALNVWLKDVDPDKVAVTASTGIAASHLRGMTINRFCGMGILNRSIADIVKTKYFHEVVGRQIREVDVLVIDECFAYNQPILTERGYDHIGRIVEQKLDVRVASRNPETGALEYKRILRWIKNPKPPTLLRIDASRTKSKRNQRAIRCTSEHKLLTWSGYIKAGDLRVGDLLSVRGPGLTPEQRSVLIGSILGDASLHRSVKRSSAQVAFMQGEAQRDYLEFKHTVFGRLAGEVTVGPSGYLGGSDVFRFTLVVTDFTQALHDEMPDDGKHPSGRRRWSPTDTFLSYVDEQALAIWWLDNGSLSAAANGSTLHTERFSRGVNTRLAVFLTDRFRIVAGVGESRGFYFLRFNKEMTEKLLSIVQRFTPPCMAWKAHGGDYAASSCEAADTTYAKIRSIEEEPASINWASVYDIEVEDHHNYVAGNIVVSNCSMLDGRALHYVDRLCRAARMDSSTPFGGLQVVAVGDFAQLPPVELDEHGFAFESDSWAQAKFRTVELTRVMRARGDEWYVWLLRCLRQGTLPPEARRILEQRHHAFDPETAGEDGAGATRLMTHNRDVDYINQRKLEALAGEKFTYKAVETGETELLGMIDKSCGSPRSLELKVGARVMFTRNDQGGRWVNGSLGVVTELKPMPEKTVLSEPDDDLEYESPIRVKILGEEDDLGVEPAEWTTDKKVVDHTGKKTAAGDPALRTVSAIRRQFPLRLAWAVTIHRAQGATLPLVSVDLGKTFAPGQAYVALSRCTSLYGLNIERWEHTSVFAHPRALAFMHDSKAAPRPAPVQPVGSVLGSPELRGVLEKHAGRAGVRPPIAAPGPDRVDEAAEF